MRTRSDHDATLWLAFGLMVVGALARLLPHAPNLSPLTAIALFGGAMLPSRWALIVPVAILAATDAILGWHDVIAFTWLSAACIGVMGFRLRASHRPTRLITASVLGSTLYFLVTNFGVWLLGDGGRMYPHTLEGLRYCYVAALPFYRLGLLGDLAWVGALFGLYHVAASRLPQWRTARVRS